MRAATRDWASQREFTSKKLPSWNRLLVQPNDLSSFVGHCGLVAPSLHHLGCNANDMDQQNAAALLHDDHEDASQFDPYEKQADHRATHLPNCHCQLTIVQGGVILMHVVKVVVVYGNSMQNY